MALAGMHSTGELCRTMAQNKLLDGVLLKGFAINCQCWREHEADTKLLLLLSTTGQFSHYSEAVNSILSIVRVVIAWLCGCVYVYRATGPQGDTELEKMINKSGKCLKALR